MIKMIRRKLKMVKRRKGKIRRWFKDNWGFVLILLAVLILTIFTFLVVLK